MNFNNPTKNNSKSYINNCSSVCCKNIFTMKGLNSSSSAPNYKLRGLVTLLYQYKICSTHVSYQNHDHLGSSLSKFGSGSSTSFPRHFSMLNLNNMSYRTPDTVTTHRINEGLQPSIPALPRPRSWYHVWGKWLLGSLFPVFLTFWKQKWNNLLKLEGEVEIIAEEVEEVAEVVEKVADATEKESAEVAEGLNEGKLKQAALVVEHVASVTAKDAQLTKDFVDMLGELKQDLKELEKIAEPAINRIVQVEHGGEK